MARAIVNRYRQLARAAQFIIGFWFLVLFLQGLGLLPWSCLNCRQIEIDIVTGRNRSSYLVLCFPVYRTVEDSALTKALSEGEQRGATPRWRRVHVFSPGQRHSPHFQYHLAISQISTLERLWGELGFTTMKRRESARNVLNTWQRDGSYLGVEKYINELRIEANSGETVPKGQTAPPQGGQTGRASGVRPSFKLRAAEVRENCVGVPGHHPWCSGDTIHDSVEESWGEGELRIEQATKLGMRS